MRATVKFLWWGATEMREVPARLDPYASLQPTRERIEVLLPTIDRVDFLAEDPIPVMYQTAWFRLHELRSPDGLPFWVYLQESGPLRNER